MLYLGQRWPWLCPCLRPAPPSWTTCDYYFGPSLRRLAPGTDSKTWIDGPDGTMFWKRAVMLHTSKDFDSWAPLPGRLCLYPDEYDVGEDPVAGAPYRDRGYDTPRSHHAPLV